MLKAQITHINLDHKMRKLDKRYHNTRPLMVDVAEMMMDAVEDNFDRGGRPKWPKLSGATQSIRRQTGKTGPILQPGHAGGLASSLSDSATRTEAIVGTNKSYAKYIQRGTRQTVTKKQRNYMGMVYGIWMKVGKVLRMPPRPFLKLAGSDVSGIKDRMARWFTGRN